MLAWSCLRWFFTLYHGKPPPNLHHGDGCTWANPEDGLMTCWEPIIPLRPGAMEKCLWPNDWFKRVPMSVCVWNWMDFMGTRVIKGLFWGFCNLRSPQLPLALPELLSVCVCLLLLSWPYSFYDKWHLSCTKYCTIRITWTWLCYYLTIPITWCYYYLTIPFTWLYYYWTIPFTWLYAITWRFLWFDDP